MPLTFKRDGQIGTWRRAGADILPAEMRKRLALKRRDRMDRRVVPCGVYWPSGGQTVPTLQPCKWIARGRRGEGERPEGQRPIVLRESHVCVRDILGT